MKPEERRLANDHQVKTFFGAYQPTWRMTKLLSLRMVLEHRDEWAKYLQDYYGPNLVCDDPYVYGEATNGIICSAISELIMYCEDLFALLKYIRESEYFVQRIVQYKAGKVTNVATELAQLSESEILSAFMVPCEKYLRDVLAASGQSEEARAGALQEYSEGVRLIIEYVHQVTTWFQQNEFFYNQYKHGLTMALKPYGSLPASAAAERRTNLCGFPVSFDNATIDAAIAEGRLLDTALIIPSLHPAIQPHLAELSRDRNLLRYYARAEVSIDEVISVARKVGVLILCLIRTRLDFVEPENPRCNTFCVPAEVSGKPFSIRQYCIAPVSEPLGLAHFAVSI